MPLATIHTRAASGLDAPSVTVEVQLSGGEYTTSIVGLTETAVKEASFRVRGALRHSGFHIPPGHVTVHLAPADLKKSGGRYDLAIALGILVPTANAQEAALVSELAAHGAGKLLEVCAHLLGRVPIEVARGPARAAAGTVLISPTHVANSPATARS